MRHCATAALVGAVFLLAPSAQARVNSRTIAVAGDIACPADQATTATRCRQREIAALTEKIDPDELWLPGDLQYWSGALEDFRSAYAESFGRFRRISRPVPGNHDYGTAGAAGYFSYFGRRAGDSSRGYYSFNSGAWHVVALNTNCGQVACGYRSTQMRWLSRDLRANPNRCVAAIMHTPRYSSGQHGDNVTVRPFWRMLLRHRAEFAVSGHDHDFEAFQPQDADGVLRPRTGIVQYVVGTGGFSLYDVDSPHSNSQWVVQGHFGVMAATLRDRGWSWRFIDEQGRSLAAGRGSCR